MTNTIKDISPRTKLWLFLLLLTAAFFRFYNLNWDEGHFFHPDERNIANAVSQIHFFTQLDPHFYAYGGFLIYLYRITADILSLLFSNSLFTTDWAYINLIGRYYSALFSTMTLLPLFLLGRKLFNEKVAFLTCIFYVFTVSSIQTAHFSITENFLTLSLVTMTYLSLLLYERKTFALTTIMGIILGISVATKTTGASFALIPFLTYGALLIQRKISLTKAFAHLFSIGILAIFLFALFSPFTFLNWESFLESMHYENGVVLGTNPVVYTLQFTNTPAYLFQLKNLFWQIGPVMLFSLIGFLYFLFHMYKTKKITYLLFLSFPLFFFFYVGHWHTKFIRYMVPLIPFFLFFASFFLLQIYKKWKLLGSLMISVSILLTVLWAIAFFSIYTREQTRISASEWIYQHVPPGSTIYGEHWDEGLPIPLESGSPLSYNIDQLTIYDPDSEAKRLYYAERLANADYITITTRRLYGTLLYLPEKYPLTKTYYELLFSGKLGYQKVAEFSSYPSLFGFTINDDLSEETFQVYDHPKSMIFQNEEKLSAPELSKILQEAQLAEQ